MLVADRVRGCASRRGSLPPTDLAAARGRCSGYWILLAARRSAARLSSLRFRRRRAPAADRRGDAAPASLAHRRRSLRSPSSRCWLPSPYRRTSRSSSTVATISPGTRRSPSTRIRDARARRRRTRTPSTSPAATSAARAVGSSPYQVMTPARCTSRPHERIGSLAELAGRCPRGANVTRAPSRRRGACAAFSASILRVAPAGPALARQAGVSRAVPWGRPRSGAARGRRSSARLRARPLPFGDQPLRARGADAWA